MTNRNIDKQKRAFLVKHNKMSEKEKRDWDIFSKQKKFITVFSI
jgi:hypothetical protein